MAYPIFAVPLYRKTFLAIDARVRDYWRSLLPSLTGMLFMIPSVVWVKRSLPPSQPLFARFFLEVAVGVFTYVAAICLFHRERVSVVLRMAGKLVPGKRKRSHLAKTVPLEDA